MLVPVEVPGGPKEKDQTDPNPEHLYIQGTGSADSLINIKNQIFVLSDTFDGQQNSRFE
jgi:hypothetical protein